MPGVPSVIRCALELAESGDAINREQLAKRTGSKVNSCTTCLAEAKARGWLRMVRAHRGGTAGNPSEFVLTEAGRTRLTEMRRPRENKEAAEVKPKYDFGPLREAWGEP